MRSFRAEGGDEQDVTGDPRHCRSFEHVFDSSPDHRRRMSGAPGLWRGGVRARLWRSGAAIMSGSRRSRHGDRAAPSAAPPGVGGLRETDDMPSTVHVLKSGRPLGVRWSGPEGGDRVVVLAHPAPGSSDFDPDPEATARQGVRLLSFDRPGYGASSLLTDLDPAGAGAGASPEQAAADIAEYLASVGIASIAAAGWSAGGRVALALAANYPGLVERVAVIGTPAPDDAVPWVGEENRVELARLAALPLDEAVRSLTRTLEAAFGSAPGVDTLVGMLASGNADAAVLETPGVRARLGRMLERAVAQGALGIAADLVGYGVQDWGFAVEAAASPALLLYGAEDAVAGRLHAEWYAARLPDSRLEVVPGRGHLLAIPEWDRVLGFLLPT
ncbi:alpha/beta hydrolase [Rathayibacter tritici]|nr:alpha/beta hydrolase [Rathayibacter tritici]PPG07056.1 alpha/beta hydrolase [Rathayibacter tritici]PPI50106.1 alpha/beta hydrolase [Rathayibacter tritici]